MAKGNSHVAQWVAKRCVGTEITTAQALSRGRKEAEFKARCRKADFKPVSNPKALPQPRGGV